MKGRSTALTLCACLALIISACDSGISPEEPGIASAADQEVAAKFTDAPASSGPNITRATYGFAFAYLLMDPESGHSIWLGTFDIAEYFCGSGEFIAAGDITFQQVEVRNLLFSQEQWSDVPVSVFGAEPFDCAGLVGRGSGYAVGTSGGGGYGLGVHASIEDALGQTTQVSARYRYGYRSGTADFRITLSAN